MEKVVVLKARPNHPKRAYRVGRHLVGAEFAPYSLNEAELSELETEGPKAWVIVKAEETEPKPVEPAPVAAPVSEQPKHKGKRR